MKFENTEVFNFRGAIRGMRNPLESWDKSDSFLCNDLIDGKKCRTCRFCENEHCNLATFDSYFVIGKNDIELMQKLIKAGKSHRKFLRQILVDVSITAPLYWWKEFDTYKVGTVANSTSTMHKITSKPITNDCFECGEMIPQETIKYLEHLRFIATSTDRPEYFRKDAWKNLIVNLPESWLQTREITLNYEVLFNMVRDRKNHKLNEWSEAFINWVRSLPYADELLFIGLE